MSLQTMRQTEIEKYKKCYVSSDYGMSDRRRIPATELLKTLAWRGSYLDVGCGRGEMVRAGQELGFTHSAGVEVTPALLDPENNIEYGVAHALPFAADKFEVVSILDVIEHLIPEDTEQVLKELGRVASRAVIITTNNQSSRFMGMELHVNIKTYPDWDATIRAAFPRACITWVPRPINGINETWLVVLPE